MIEFCDEHSIFNMTLHHLYKNQTIIENNYGNKE